MQRGKLKQKDEECLQKHYVELKQNMDALNLIDLLYQEKVITNDHREKIKKETTKSERNEILLQALLDSGPGDNFDTFISALKPNYSHLKIVQERSHLCGPHEESIETSIPDQIDGQDNHSEIQIKLFDITVLVVGESRCGKSSTCRTLTSLNTEEESITGPSGNKQIETRRFNGRRIGFVDSPNIEHHRRDTKKLINEVQKSIDNVSGGFHAFLLIIKYRKVIKNEDVEIIKTIKSLYGPDILKNYCVLVVTYGDQLKAENVNFKDWCLKQEGVFKNVYEECGRRAVMIDNTKDDKEILTNELTDLIDEIDHLQFNGRRYTADHFKKAESGRKRMLIEENKSNIFEDISAKCISMIQISQSINLEFTEENVRKLNCLFNECLTLKNVVEIKDEGTGILEGPLKLIESVAGVIKGKLDILNTKESERKTLWEKRGKEEQRILKMIERGKEKARDENEKLALKQELMAVKETNLRLKQELLMKEEQRRVLKLENVPTVDNSRRNMPFSMDYLNLILHNCSTVETVQTESLHTKQIQKQNPIVKQSFYLESNDSHPELFQIDQTPAYDSPSKCFQENVLKNEFAQNKNVPNKSAYSRQEEVEIQRRFMNLHNLKHLDYASYLFNLIIVGLVIILVLSRYTFNKHGLSRSEYGSESLLVQLITKHAIETQRVIDNNLKSLTTSCEKALTGLEMLRKKHHLSVQVTDTLKNDFTQLIEHFKKGVIPPKE